MRLIKPKIEKVKQTPNPKLDNTVQYWGFFTPEQIAAAANDGSLLMLDMDFGRGCELRCPGCFRRKNPVDEQGRPDLHYHEIINVVDVARSLGLKTIKVCGAGESSEDSRLLRFARDLTRKGIGLALFTKGHIIGDDEAAAKIFGQEGIKNGADLCRQLFELKVSIMLSYPSFNNRLIGQLVGRRPEWYAPKLKRAAELLAEAGFNQTRPTRLAFVHAPLTKNSISQAFEVYQYARERNILPILAFSMVSGEQITPKFLDQYDADEATKLNLFQQVLEYNFKHGFMSPQDVIRDEPSCMPGIHPCNQIAVGLYVTANGNVLRCPGDFHQPLGNVREEGLAEIWRRCRKWQWEGKFNVGCPYKDGCTIPKGIYEELTAYAKSFLYTE